MTENPTTQYHQPWTGKKKKKKKEREQEKLDFLAKEPANGKCSGDVVGKPIPRSSDSSYVHKSISNRTWQAKFSQPPSHTLQLA